MVCLYVLFHSFLVGEAFTTMSAKIGVFILKNQAKIIKGPFTLSANQRESDTIKKLLPFNFHGKKTTTQNRWVWWALKDSWYFLFLGDHVMFWLNDAWINSGFSHLMFYLLMHISYIFSPVHQWTVAAFVPQNTLGKMFMHKYRTASHMKSEPKTR